MFMEWAHENIPDILSRYPTLQDFCAGFPMVQTGEGWSGPEYAYGTDEDYVIPLQDVYDHLQWLDDDFVNLEAKMNSLKGIAFAGKDSSNPSGVQLDPQLECVAQWLAILEYLQDDHVLDLYHFVSDRVLGRFVHFGEVCRDANAMGNTNLRWIACIDWVHWYQTWERLYVHDVEEAIDVSLSWCLEGAIASARRKVSIALSQLNKETTPTQETLDRVITAQDTLDEVQLLQTRVKSNPIDLSFLLQQTRDPAGLTKRQGSPVAPQCDVSAPSCPNHPPSCEDKACDGRVNDPTNNTASCSGSLAGCPCIPNGLTPGYNCGQPQSCQLNGCDGAASYPNGNLVATCQDNFKGCNCQADGNTPGFNCGERQSCYLNGCSGTASYPNGNLVAKCQAAFAGCDCIPYKDMPGFSCPESPVPYCQDNGCDGAFLAGSSEYAICQKNFQNCPCVADTRTSGFCPDTQQTCHACQGDANNLCQTPKYKGCSCNPAQAAMSSTTSTEEQSPAPSTTTEPVPMQTGYYPPPSYPPTCKGDNCYANCCSGYICDMKWCGLYCGPFDSDRYMFAMCP